MLTPKSHHPTIKMDSPHSLKNSVSIGRKGARGGQGRAQAKATATAMEAGVSLDIQVGRRYCMKTHKIRGNNRQSEAVGKEIGPMAR